MTDWKVYIIKFFYNDAEMSSKFGYAPRHIITIAKDSDHAYAKLEKDTANIGGVNVIDVHEFDTQILKDDIYYI